MAIPKTTQKAMHVELLTLGRRFEPVLCVSVMNVSQVEVPAKREIEGYSITHWRPILELNWP